MSKIEINNVRQIFDSRENPTIETKEIDKDILLSSL